MSPTPPPRDPLAAAARQALHDGAASRAIERAAAATLPPHTLMQRAGAGLARLALALAPHAPCVRIVAGPGNNGGDGFEAALQLHRAGRRVSVSLLGDASALPADAAAARQRAQLAGIEILDRLPSASAAADDLLIDALFGLGLSRAPAGAAAEAIAWLNRGPAPVLAVDLPSGLDGDRGQPLEPSNCVRARWTLALLTLKPGLFTAAGRDHAGRVWFDGLGVDEIANRTEPLAELAAGAALSTLRPRRRHAQHKGSFGDLWVVGGAPSMGGAALLAARAALRAGAGRVHVHPLDPAAALLDPLQPELMFRPALPAAADLAQLTVVAGCGGGDRVGNALPTLLHRAGRLLLDADALNAIAADSTLAARLRARAGHGLPSILTPHPLEAARLLETDTRAVQADRIGAAMRLAERYGATIVLKGSGSVVAAPGRRPSINPSGNAALASPGTGDVLAGWISGLWSQGLADFDAARLGCFQHGCAAEAWSRQRGRIDAMPASVLIDRLGVDR
jgi:ADP-dependent NAD(P)H-hydrate dehydratase / NAD(P)H-hydrate epimerase